MSVELLDEHVEFDDAILRCPFLRSLGDAALAEIREEFAPTDTPVLDEQPTRVAEKLVPIPTNHKEEVVDKLSQSFESELIRTALFAETEADVATLDVGEPYVAVDTFSHEHTVDGVPADRRITDLQLDLINVDILDTTITPRQLSEQSVAHEFVTVLPLAAISATPTSLEILSTTASEAAIPLVVSPVMSSAEVIPPLSTEVPVVTEGVVLIEDTVRILEGIQVLDDTTPALLDTIQPAAIGGPRIPEIYSEVSIEPVATKELTNEAVLSRLTPAISEWLHAVTDLDRPATQEKEDAVSQLIKRAYDVIASESERSDEGNSLAVEIDDENSEDPLGQLVVQILQQYGVLSPTPAQVEQLIAHIRAESDIDTDMTMAGSIEEQLVVDPMHERLQAIMASLGQLPVIQPGRLLGWLALHQRSAAQL